MLGGEGSGAILPPEWPVRPASGRSASHSALPSVMGGCRGGGCAVGDVHHVVDATAADAEAVSVAATAVLAASGVAAGSAEEAWIVVPNLPPAQPVS